MIPDDDDFPIILRDRVRALLAKDGDLQDRLPPPQDGKAFAITKGDPGSVPPPLRQGQPAQQDRLGQEDRLGLGVDVCLAIPGLGVFDDTLGDVGARDMQVTQLALIVYVWASKTDPERDDLCVLLTTRTLRALRRYEVDKTADGLSYWHKQTFPRRPLATTFHQSETKHYLSITPINFYGQLRRKAPVRRP